MLTGVSGYAVPLPAGEGGSLTYSAGNYVRYLIPVSTTAGGLMAGILVYKLAPGTEGLGINSAINAFHNLKARIRNRTPAVKLVSSALVIGSGGSAGRDGPVALISAVFGSFLANLFHLNDHDRRIVMASGIGAGIGSIFMAPIGGAIMSTEILYRKDFEVEALIPATVASLVGYAIFGFQFHYVTLFSVPTNDFLFSNPLSIIVYASIGVVAGAASKFYVRLYDLIHLAFLRMRHIPIWVKPAIGGLLVGVIAMFYPEVLGLGYGFVQLILSGTLTLTLFALLLLFFAKILATSFSVGSGGAGGVFAPSIVTGAFLGAFLAGTLGHYLPFSPEQEIIIVTMLAFFAASAKTPISMLVMGTEMVGGLDMFLPLTIAITIAYFLSGGRDSLYGAQVMNKLHSPAHLYEYRQDIMHGIPVGDIMNRNFITCSKDSTIEEVLFRMKAHRARGIVVESTEGPQGYITMGQVELEYKFPRRRLRDIGIPETASISRTTPMDKVLSILPDDTQGAIIVLDRKGGKICGTVGFDEVADGYQEAYLEFKTRQMSQA